MSYKHSIFLLILFSNFNLHGQAPDFEARTFYPYSVEHAQCLSVEKRNEIKTTLRENIESLKKSGHISAAQHRSIVSLEWPLRLAEGFTDIGFHGISAFVDHNSNFPASLEDYNCGTRTFDSSSGFNHSGTDIFLWPFGWSMMEEGRVDVVSAADGIVIGKLDGNYDGNCSGQDTTSWNAIYIRHDDGSVAWYGHLKTNSLTTAPIGGVIQQGEYLGKVGSSGASSGPHLHFEVYEDEVLMNLIDPFAGNCNNLNTISSWADQKPYYDSGINRISTHHALPFFPSCPMPEIKNEENNFCDGDQVFFLVFLRDLLFGQTIYHQLIKPDGTTFTNWETTYQAGDHLAASWYFEYAVIPEDADIGPWKYRVDFLGTTAFHTFNVCAPVDIDEPIDPEPVHIFPNPTSDFINIEFPDFVPENTQLLIYGVDGKMERNQILDANQSLLNVNLTSLSSGIYMISIVENGQIKATKRIIKI